VHHARTRQNDASSFRSPEVSGTANEGVKQRHSLSTAIVWPVRRDNLETVRGRI